MPPGSLPPSQRSVRRWCGGRLPSERGRHSGGSPAQSVRACRSGEQRRGWKSWSFRLVCFILVGQRAMGRRQRDTWPGVTSTCPPRPAHFASMRALPLLSRAAYPAVASVMTRRAMAVALRVCIGVRCC